ncbi:MAG: HipA N-terminal domain-containing protein [Bacteroidales bacterium]|nr:HipA N-terminal domain-containing protein [Bacteroidales bacterium]MBR3413233.1 HipA N-terminal domain-containing protein [Bacteroidales bacterium]
MRQLNVLWNDQPAGILTELAPNNGYRFEYAMSYLNSNLPHVSVTLPKTSTPYESERLFPFFANMLPEGSLRRVICREHHVDENDLFGILYATADTDTIGAVSFKKQHNEQ